MGKPVERMSVGERTHFAKGAAALGAVEAEMRALASRENGLPREWSEVAGEMDRAGGRERVRLTVPVDAAVARFFRSAGPGHLERMNRVLRAFVEFRLARAVTGADWCDVVADPKGTVRRWDEWASGITGSRRRIAEAKRLVETAQGALAAETERADRAEAAAREMAALMREMVAELEAEEEDEGDGEA